MKRFAERLKHVMFIANMVLVTATIVPYVYGLSIEPSTGRCVNFSGEPRWVSVDLRGSRTKRQFTYETTDLFVNIVLSGFSLTRRPLKFLKLGFGQFLLVQCLRNILIDFLFSLNLGGWASHITCLLSLCIF